MGTEEWGAVWADREREGQKRSNKGGWEPGRSWEWEGIGTMLGWEEGCQWGVRPVVTRTAEE